MDNTINYRSLLIKKGDIIEFKRLGGLYYHYAIYIGDNKVIHRDKQKYGGVFINNLYDVPGIMKIVPSHPRLNKIPTQTAIQNALSIANTDDDSKTYNVFTRNCEHFVNKIRYNCSKSNQVDRILNILFGFGFICICKKVIDFISNLKYDFFKAYFLLLR